MNETEEPLPMVFDEITFQQPAGVQRQAELIRRYCSGIEERIDDAPSKEEAVHIVDETCARLEQSCESEVIRAFLRTAMEARVEHRWQGKQ